MSSYLNTHNQRTFRQYQKHLLNRVPIMKKQHNKTSISDNRVVKKNKAMIKKTRAAIIENKIQDSEICHILQQTLMKLNLLHIQYVREDLNNRKTIQCFSNIHNNSLKVSLLDGYIIKKEFKNRYRIDAEFFYNELKAFTFVKSHPHFPQLVFFDRNKKVIYMTFCGQTLSPTNLPQNWETQLSEIGDIVIKTNFNPNDIIKRNICVLDNIIYLIDFGLAIIGNVDRSLVKLKKLLVNMSRS